MATEGVGEGCGRGASSVAMVQSREAMALVGARYDYQMRRVPAQPCAMHITEDYSTTSVVPVALPLEGIRLRLKIAAVSILAYGSVLRYWWMYISHYPWQMHQEYVTNLSGYLESSLATFRK